jgi:hypothetical protein
VRCLPKAGVCFFNWLTFSCFARVTA